LCSTLRQLVSARPLFGPLGGGGGGGCFQAGDNLSQTFVGTGQASAISSAWNFQMSDFTALGVVNTFDAAHPGRLDRPASINQAFANSA